MILQPSKALAITFHRDGCDGCNEICVMGVMMGVKSCHEEECELPCCSRASQSSDCLVQCRSSANMKVTYERKFWAKLKKTNFVEQWWVETWRWRQISLSRGVKFRLFLMAKQSKVKLPNENWLENQTYENSSNSYRINWWQWVLINEQ